MNDRDRRLAWSLALALALALGTAPAAAGADSDPAADVVADYLDAMVRQDWEAARLAWRPADLARAERLEIHYETLPLKIDGDSDLARTAATAGLTAAGCGEPAPHPLAELLTEPPVLTLVPARGRAPGGERQAAHPYVAVETDAGWRLAAPVGLVLEDCARRPGAVREGQYVRTVTGPGMEGRVPALTALDSFVEVTLRRLDIAPERRELLAREKIDYLFVPPDWVELLAGAPTVGVANLQVDAVVTHHPCHLHELAHILVNFRLADLPLYTLPVLQEGLAVHLGGRWGRGPDFLAQVGTVFLRDGYVALPDLLPRDHFYRLGADLSYAPAGVLVGWLLEVAGSDAFLGTYRALSGQPEHLSALAPDEVARTLGQLLDLPEADVAALTTAFRSYLASLSGNPLRPAPFSPEDEPLRRLIDAGLELLLWRQDGAWLVQITAPPGEVPAGALLVTGTAPASALFREHFPDATVDPALAALRFSPEEAGWYDYRRDLLVAKHIAAFWPEPAAYNPQTRTLRLAWPTTLLPWDPSGDAVVLRRDAPRAADPR